MKIVKTIPRLRHVLTLYRTKGKRIGFVPTMGYFHDGHLSLMRRAKKDNDIVVVSIFVNPTQFSPGEDLARYPRDFKHDECLAKKENVDIIFYPSTKEIYPSGYLTYVDVEGMSRVLCGKSRPTHFRGVATIVCKLLNIAAVDILYLGQKDAQQSVLLKKMIQDLNIPVHVKICPIVREDDGLAMSSRNKYLSHQKRLEAPILFQALCHGKKIIAKGERNPLKIENAIKAHIRKNSSAQIDYVSCVNADTLLAMNKLHGRVLIALAAYFGKTRLIDNVILNIS